MHDVPCRPMKVAVLCAGLLACSSSSSGAAPLEEHRDGSLLPPVEASVNDGAGAGKDSTAADDSPDDSPGDSLVVSADDASDATEEVAPPISGCNAIVPSGPQVGETAASGSLPAPVGGTIATGTYFLTEIDLYGAPMTGLVVQRTLVVDATKMNFAELVGPSAEAGASPDAGAADDSTSTYTLYGTVVSLGEYCPTNGAADNIFFSAQGNTLTLFVSSTKAEVYTLQPSPEP